MAPRESLLEEVLPRFDVSSRHELPVPAPAARVWESLSSADLRDTAIARLLLRLRGYGARTRRPEGKQTLVESLSALGFVLIDERPGRELVFGLIGRFWTPSGGLVAASPEEFLRFGEKGYAKAAWDLAVLPETESASVLTTETRVLCFGAAARRRFRVYWALVEPFSGILRKAMLRSIRNHSIANQSSGKGSPR